MTITPITTPGQDGDPPSLSAVVAMVDELREVLLRVREVTWQATGSGLADTLGRLGELALAVDAAEVAVLADAVQRGEPGAGVCGLAPTDWVSAHSRRYPSGRSASAVVKLAEGIRCGSVADCLGQAVLAGRVPVPAARTAVAEMTKLIPDLQEPFIPMAWESFTTVAETGDPATVRALRFRIIAEYGDAGRLGQDEAKGRTRMSLSHGVNDGGPLTSYRLTLDPESVAALEAALGPLSAPRPGPDGDPDPRCATNRRAHALMDLIARAAGADTAAPGRGSTHTALIIGLSDLREETGAATPAGAAGPGGSAAFLSPIVARARTCSGRVSPIVVDEDGNPILIGRAHRLFTTAQFQALMVRDAGCTFPGCTRPAGWTDAHHLVHWIDGGSTDLDNAALLCRMHHTIVHTRRLTGRVTTGPPDHPHPGRLRVVWDLTPGSYDTHLATKRAKPA
ncbi:MAG: HNH endonuclease signature motif containing protein [Dermatophilaceae bacterium]